MIYFDSTPYDTDCKNARFKFKINDQIIVRIVMHLIAFLYNDVTEENFFFKLGHFKT